MKFENYLAILALGCFSKLLETLTQIDFQYLLIKVKCYENINMDFSWEAGLAKRFGIFLEGTNHVR